MKIMSMKVNWLTNPNHLSSIQALSLSGNPSSLKLNQLYNTDYYDN